jgi:hypothetical protein
MQLRQQKKACHAQRVERELTLAQYFRAKQASALECITDCKAVDFVIRKQQGKHEVMRDELALRNASRTTQEEPSHERKGNSTGKRERKSAACGKKLAFSRSEGIKWLDWMTLPGRRALDYPTCFCVPHELRMFTKLPKIA